MLWPLRVDTQRKGKTINLICPAALGMENAADIFISYRPARTHVANPSAARGHGGEFFLIDRCWDALYFNSYLFACFSASDLHVLRHAISISTTLIPHGRLLQRWLSYIMAPRLGSSSCSPNRYSKQETPTTHDPLRIDYNPTREKRTKDDDSLATLIGVPLRGNDSGSSC